MLQRRLSQEVRAGAMQPAALALAPDLQAQVVIMGGPSGCGKSTAGRLLASRTRATFYEGDDFHPPGNIGARRRRGAAAAWRCSEPVGDGCCSAAQPSSALGSPSPTRTGAPGSWSSLRSWTGTPAARRAGAPSSPARR